MKYHLKTSTMSKINKLVWIIHTLITICKHSCVAITTPLRMMMKMMMWQTLKHLRLNFTLCSKFWNRTCTWLGVKKLFACKKEKQLTTHVFLGTRIVLVMQTPNVIFFVDGCNKHYQAWVRVYLFIGRPSLSHFSILIFNASWRRLKMMFL